MTTEDTLARVTLFSELSRRDLKRLAAGTISRNFAKGDIIVKEGEQAIAFYLMCTGRAEVVKGVDGSRPRVLGTLGPSDFFGDMALLDGYLRSATVRALEDTECLVLTRWDFLAEVHTNPSIAVHMLPVLSRRLRDEEAQLAT
jgi:CRP/FNR family transcriptional regulator, cyclic AMP receptor protein